MLVADDGTGSPRGPLPRHPGARPGAALRALGDRLQLPPEQPAGRHRPRPAAAARRARRGAPANIAFYREALGDLPGIAFMPEAPYGPTSTAGSPASLVDAGEFGATATRSRRHLERADIEARPVWKPMHLQPVFAGCRTVGGAVARVAVPARPVPAERLRAGATPSARAWSRRCWRRRGRRGGRAPRRRQEARVSLRLTAMAALALAGAAPQQCGHERRLRGGAAAVGRELRRPRRRGDRRHRGAAGGHRLARQGGHAAVRAARLPHRGRPRAAPAGRRAPRPRRRDAHGRERGRRALSHPGRSSTRNVTIAGGTLVGSRSGRARLGRRHPGERRGGPDDRGRDAARLLLRRHPAHRQPRLPPRAHPARDRGEQPADRPRHPCRYGRHGGGQHVPRQPRPVAAGGRQLRAERGGRGPPGASSGGPRSRATPASGSTCTRRSASRSTDVTAEDNVVRGNDQGIVASGAEGARIVRNRVSGHRTRGRSGIALGDGTGALRCRTTCSRTTCAASWPPARPG